MGAPSHAAPSAHAHVGQRAKTLGGRPSARERGNVQHPRITTTRIRTVEKGEAGRAIPDTDRQGMIRALEARVVLEETTPKVINHFKDVSKIAKALGAPPEMVTVTCPGFLYQS